MIWAWLLSTVGMVVFGGLWVVTLGHLDTAEVERDKLYDQLHGIGGVIR